jgi:hypothetical protein
MSIWDSTVNRKYRCHDKECNTEVFAEQKISDDWLKICPECGQETLYIESANTNVVGIIDTKTPKTLGVAAERNRDRMIKNGESTEGFAKQKDKKVWWRKSDKIDRSILNNPEKYIATGKK